MLVYRNLNQVWASAASTSGLVLQLRPVGRVSEIVLVDGATGRVLARLGSASSTDGWEAWNDIHDLRTLSRWEPMWDALSDLCMAGWVGRARVPR